MGGPPPWRWYEFHVSFFTSRRADTATRRHKSEEIDAKLRQVDVLKSQGQSVAVSGRLIGVSEVTNYIWRQFGGPKIDQVRRLKKLDAQDTRLRQEISDLTPDKLILKEAANGKF